MDPLDRRDCKRVPAQLVVQYRTGQELRRDLVANRSAGGIFIRTSRPLPIGSEFELVIEIEGEAPAKVRGKVVWERLYGKGVPPHEPEGMGVAFIGEIDPRIQKWGE